MGALLCGPLHWHSHNVMSVAFSQDSKHIVSGSADNTICIWDVETGTRISGPFQGHSCWVMSVAFSPDGKYVVSGSADMTICIWDVEMGAAVSGPLQGHTGKVHSVSFSHDGKHIVSGSADKTIRIWDVDTTVSFLQHGNFIIICFYGIVTHCKFSAAFKGNLRIDDGWILGCNSELLFWVPPFNREGLWKPNDVCVIGESITRLDMSNFTHGTTWAHFLTIP